MRNSRRGGGLIKNVRQITGAASSRVRCNPVGCSRFVGRGLVIGRLDDYLQIGGELRHGVGQALVLLLDLGVTKGDVWVK